MADDGKGKKFEKFQVEIERLGQKNTLEVDVRDVRAGRGKRVIVTEGIYHDNNNWVRIATRGAKTYQATIPLTLDCIDTRGWLPLSYRIWTGTGWGPWNDVVGFPKTEPAGQHTGDLET